MGRSTGGEGDRAVTIERSFDLLRDRSSVGVARSDEATPNHLDERAVRQPALPQPLERKALTAPRPADSAMTSS